MKAGMPEYKCLRPDGECTKTGRVEEKRREL